MIRASVALAAMLLVMAGCASMDADSARPAWRQPGPAAEGPLERHIVPDDGFRADLATHRTMPWDLPARGPAHAT
jgi:hypothetical protein